MWSFEHAAFDADAVLMQATKTRAINRCKILKALVHVLSIGTAFSGGAC